ncbi:hypothetical protein IE81DRAFT_350571 [Ceraceosorus guamensis]|uniref:Uncharacterized protein n=1 Tax=Ceraceosorus guamensis TaxID=1522189 RepID=A0A316VN28_9BASI|nr:hypothetical protein IE81DRAFT_350571 [Ceraceosorus guamensis]PWN38982.1 hypothetical protein IE81DRAFT_350571 [Ceraceosorus guamensis]
MSRISIALKCVALLASLTSAQNAAHAQAPACPAAKHNARTATKYPGTYAEAQQAWFQRCKALGDAANSSGNTIPAFAGTPPLVACVGAAGEDLGCVVFNSFDGGWELATPQVGTSPIGS